ncbi:MULTISPECIES: hypothetical protein [Pseudomonas]|uniref:hypothetical protein n=1 Tax=Pseudomonas TaxID=286 RepID=UPI0002DA1897|nr:MULTISPECIES: hypothetical protein [Pseudomonas]WOB56566.1 hypothetical protein NY023_15125 [Pseudomonas sp. NBB]
MAFSDILQGDSLNQLFQNPMMLAGLQMLAQSGPQQGNPGFGARLGAAGMNTVQQIAQQQHSQQLNAYRQQMIAQQQAEMQMRQQAAQAKADQLQRQQQAFADPAVQEQMGPLAKMLAAAGLGPDVVLKANSADNLNAHRQAQLQQQASQFDQRLSRQGGGGSSSGPRMPAPRPYIDQPIGNNQMQRFKYDPATQDYAPWGEPFSQYSPGKTTGAQAAADAILNAEPPAAGPDLGSLPGTGGLQSYAPQPQQPVGVMPLAAQGGGLQAQTQQPGTRKPGQPKVATPMTREDYDALPSGAQYIDPASGRVATKR